MLIILSRFLGYLFSWISLGAITALGLCVAIMAYFNREMPDLAYLNDYAPATVSRVYSDEGEVIDEFAIEKRLFTPADEIPTLVKQAFISAEDKNFYTHPGYDLRATVGALVEALRSDSDRGASTIPQQVAKNFFLSGERSIERKIKEVLIAVKLVNDIDRDQILGLYLNEIFLGQNSYGVTAAARTYFGKKLEELNIQEMAYLAAIPKGPSNYHPVRDYEAAIVRRDYVLEEMFENGYIDADSFEFALKTKLETVQSGDIPDFETSRPRRDYFTDEIRRQLTLEFGEEELFNEGLSARATIDRHLQNTAKASLRRALESYDRNLGMFAGPIAEVDEEALSANWQDALSATVIPRDIDGWFPAVVLETQKGEMTIGVEGHGEASLGLSDFNWARYKPEGGGNRKTAGSTSDMFKRGDALLVKQKDNGVWTYRQIPVVSGAFAAMDPNSGRVLAVVGGFSYESSNFNRATQAMRQPGSTFKPFVYAAALDSGYQPNAMIVDAPIKKSAGGEIWEPKNAGGGYYGATPMMTGLEQSRNLMTVRLATDVGMDIVASYGERYGVYDDMKPYLANALGSQETTLYRMISAFSTFANGGKKVTPTVVDRVQDRQGKTIFRHDTRDCMPCVGQNANPENPPRVMSNFEQVMDPVTALQIKIMLQSAVARGTGKQTVGKLGLPIAGKTGTTNDAKDAWFIGFTPNIVAGCYIGYDNPTPLLNGSASGGGLCGPVFSRFIVEALKTHGGFEYEIPENGYFVNIDRKSGARLGDGATGDNVVRMFFRGDTVPDVGIAPNVIDGGLAPTENFKKIDVIPEKITPTKKKEAEVEVKVQGTTKKAPKNPSAGTITGGGLY